MLIAFKEWRQEQQQKPKPRPRQPTAAASAIAPAASASSAPRHGSTGAAAAEARVPGGVEAGAVTQGQVAEPHGPSAAAGAGGSGAHAAPPHLAPRRQDVEPIITEVQGVYALAPKALRDAVYAYLDR